MSVKKIPAIKLRGKETLRAQEQEKFKEAVARQKQENSVSDTALHEAHMAVTARMENYGEQLTNFTNIAELWTVLLKNKLVEPITPQDVAQCQIAVKQARLMKSPTHRDSIIDIAGYAECLDQINKAEEPREGVNACAPACSQGNDTGYITKQAL